MIDIHWKESYVSDFIEKSVIVACVQTFINRFLVNIL